MDSLCKLLVAFCEKVCYNVNYRPIVGIFVDCINRKGPVFAVKKYSCPKERTKKGEGL